MSAPRGPLLAGIGLLALVLAVAVLVGTVVTGHLGDPTDAADVPGATDAAGPTDAADPPGADGDAEVAGPGPATPPDGVPADAEPATVERVVDGDTLRVRLPSAPDSGTTSVPVRLLNIDAPELARDGQPEECLAEEATTRMAELVPPGSTVWLVADREERDRFDRLLRGVWTGEGGFVNETLVAEGYAEAILVRPNDRFDAAMRAAERAAQRAGVGIWGAACAG